MKLIDKSAVVAEIEKLKGQLLRGACSSQISMQTRCKEESYDEVLSFLDTIEVKEVDLDEEIKRFTMSKELYETKSVIRTVAKHFFELGLNASNPLTWEDIHKIDMILGCTAKENSLLGFTKDYYKRVLKRFKAQKVV